MSNSKFYFSISVAQFQINFAKKLLTSALSKIYNKNAFHEVLFLSAGVIFLGFGKSSQLNISLVFAYSVLLIKKCVYLEKKATHKKDFLTSKIDVRLVR